MSNIIFEQKEDIEMLKNIILQYCGDYRLTTSEVLSLTFKYIANDEVVSFIRELYKINEENE